MEAEIAIKVMLIGLFVALLVNLMVDSRKDEGEDD